MINFPTRVKYYFDNKLAHKSKILFCFISFLVQGYLFTEVEIVQNKHTLPIETELSVLSEPNKNRCDYFHSVCDS